MAVSGVIVTFMTILGSLVRSTILLSAVLLGFSLSGSLNGTGGNNSASESSDSLHVMNLVYIL